LFAPAFPAQGRIVRDARLLVKGKPSSGDLRALLSKAGLPATQVEFPSPDGLRAALRIGARAFVCDAASDADLDRIARAGLALRPRPLFVGSAGLARALARTLSRRRAAAVPPRPRWPVVTVVGSASPISRIQVQRLDRSRRRGPILQIEWTHEPTRKDLARVRNLGRIAARVQRAHYVLTGGETARAVLDARGIRALRLLGEVEPGVPFAMARDGTLVCTKAGAFGGPQTLLRCVARLQREMKKS
jgi:4-hydroxythreonine-4-phosphate dehydrogenase